MQEFSAHQLTHTPMSAHTRQPKLCTFCIYSEAQPSHKHMQASQCLAYDFSSPYKSAVQANCCCVCLFLQFLISVWFAAFTPFYHFKYILKLFLISFLSHVYIYISLFKQDINFEISDVNQINFLFCIFPANSVSYNCYLPHCASHHIAIRTHFSFWHLHSKKSFSAYEFMEKLRTSI